MNPAAKYYILDDTNAFNEVDYEAALGNASLAGIMVGAGHFAEGARSGRLATNSASNSETTFEKMMSPEDAAIKKSHVIGDCDWFDDVAKIENGGVKAKLRYERWEQTRMEGIDLQDINDFITAKNRPTRAEFGAMKNTPEGTLSPEEFRQMKIIRESIPAMDGKITIRKIVKWDDLDNYINKDWRITGYVAKADDVKPFITYGEVRDAVRLDYTYLDNNGKLVIPYPEGGNAYGYIDFIISMDDFIDIPYAESYGGAYQNGQPYSGNGFLLTKQDANIPEYIINKNIYPEGVAPQQGEIHLVVGEEDVIVGDWSRRDNGWMYHSN